jgi:hypothetical protein
MENQPSPPELEYYLRPLNYAVVGDEAATDSTSDASSNPDASSDAGQTPAEVAQKVYLAVQAGVLTKAEARQMVAAAGAELTPGVPAELSTAPGGAA